MALEDASATLLKSPKKGKKYFSLSEANRSLLYIARIVEEITAYYKKAIDLQYQIEQSQHELERALFQEPYEQAMDRLNELLDELHQVGVELKDFEKGLVDFPAIHEGREIYLCWRSGEPRVEAWHEIEAGFADRQDIALLED